MLHKYTLYEAYNYSLVDPGNETAHVQGARLFICKEPSLVPSPPLAVSFAKC